MDKEKFQDELRARITDFAVSHYLIGMSETKTNAQKKKQAEEAYKKLEAWILDNRPSDSSEEIPVSREPVPPSEDQGDLGF